MSHTAYESFLMSLIKFSCTHTRNSMNACIIRWSNISVWSSFGASVLSPRCYADGLQMLFAAAVYRKWAKGRTNMRVKSDANMIGMVFAVFGAAYNNAFYVIIRHFCHSFKTYVYIDDDTRAHTHTRSLCNWETCASTKRLHANVATLQAHTKFPFSAYSAAFACQNNDKDMMQNAGMWTITMDKWYARVTDNSIIFYLWYISCHRCARFLSCLVACHGDNEFIFIAMACCGVNTDKCLFFFHLFSSVSTLTVLKNECNISTRREPWIWCLSCLCAVCALCVWCRKCLFYLQ